MFKRLISNLVFATVIFYSKATTAQRVIEDYVKEHTVPVNSIDPDSTDFADLLPFAKAIGDARVVLLGEQDHGDAMTFSAKSRLVKFLHEKLGFNVLAFECDFFSLNAGWDQVGKSSDKILPFIQDNVLHLWSQCENCNDLLYDYIPTTFKNGKPLQISGFDSQMFHKFATSNLMNSLDSLIKSLDLEIGKKPEYETKIKPLFDSLIRNHWHKVLIKGLLPDNEIEECGTWLKVLQLEVREKLDTAHFWTMVIENLVSQNRVFRTFSERNIVNSIRDAQMASNIQWLLTTKYPNEKIIVWAANMHTQKSDMFGFNSMGKVLYNALNGKMKMYSLGFTSYSGSSGRLGKPSYGIKRASKHSLEGWINPQFNFAFLDYTKFNREHPGSTTKFYQRGYVYQSFRKEWNNIYDGIFFIRVMAPCKFTKSLTRYP